MSSLVFCGNEDNCYDSIMLAVVNNNLWKLDRKATLSYKRKKGSHEIFMNQEMDNNDEIHVLIFKGVESQINPFLIGFNAAIKHSLAVKSGMSVLEVETRSHLEDFTFRSLDAET